MRRGLIATIATMLCAVVAPRISLAQCTANGAPANCGVPGSVLMTAGRVVRLQMGVGSTALTAPTTSDFDAGFNSTTGPTLTVSANAPHPGCFSFVDGDQHIARCSGAGEQTRLGSPMEPGVGRRFRGVDNHRRQSHQRDRHSEYRGNSLLPDALQLDPRHAG